MLLIRDAVAGTAQVIIHSVLTMSIVGRQRQVGVKRESTGVAERRARGGLFNIIDDVIVINLVFVVVVVES